MPAFNEEARLGPALERLLAEPWLRGDTEIVVVDDGSSDATAEIARERLREAPYGRVVSLPWNSGKGAAVRLGVASARGDYVIFMDADMSTDLCAVPRALHLLTRFDVVLGSRTTPGAVVTGRSTSRDMMSRAFSAHARQLAGVGVSDPQCGFKAFRAEAAKMLFHLSRVDRFGFDVEVIVLAQRLGLRITEVPVRWRAVDGSKVRALRDPFSMAVDVAKVRLRHRRRPPSGVEPRSRA